MVNGWYALILGVIAFSCWWGGRDLGRHEGRDRGYTEGYHVGREIGQREHVDD